MKYTTNQNHDLRITRQFTKQHFNNQLVIQDQLVQQFHERQRKKKKKKKEKKQDDDDNDEDEDETYYPSQDYGDNSNVDPEYRPSKKELKGADKEGDK